MSEQAFHQKSLVLLILANLPLASLSLPLSRFPAVAGILPRHRRTFGLFAGSLCFTLLLLLLCFSREKIRSQKASKSSAQVPRWWAWRLCQLVRIIFVDLYFYTWEEQNNKSAELLWVFPFSHRQLSLRWRIQQEAASPQGAGLRHQNETSQGDPWGQLCEYQFSVFDICLMADVHCILCNSENDHPCVFCDSDPPDWPLPLPCVWSRRWGGPAPAVRWLRRQLPHLLPDPASAGSAQGGLAVPKVCCWGNAWRMSGQFKF